MLLAQDLPGGQIEVIKDFEVRLVEAKKIRIVPQPTALDSTVRRYEYKLLVPSPQIVYLVPEIKPLAINPEQKPVFYDESRLRYYAAEPFTGATPDTWKEMLTKMEMGYFNRYTFLLISHSTKAQSRESELLRLKPRYREIARFPDEKKRKFIVIYQNLDAP